MAKDELSALLDLADEIGEKIAKGYLPAQDENGFYILPGDPRYVENQ